MSNSIYSGHIDDVDRDDLEIRDHGSGDIANSVGNSSSSSIRNSSSSLEELVLDTERINTSVERSSLVHRLPQAYTASPNSPEYIDQSESDTLEIDSPPQIDSINNINNNREQHEEEEDEEIDLRADSKYHNLKDQYEILEEDIHSPKGAILLDSPYNIVRNLNNNISFKNNNNYKNNNNGFLDKWISKRNLKIAAIVLLISNLGFGTFFSYTSPEALSHTFYNTFNIDSKQFGSLFTLYAIPNVCMVFITGILVDIFGPDPVSIILSSIVTFSTFIGALSPPNFSVMLLSRFILGFAGESLVACSNALMSKWFDDRLLSTFLGIAVGWIYGANVASLIILPILNKTIGFKMSLWFICFVSAFGTALNVVYLLINKKFKDISKDAEMDIILRDLESNVMDDTDESSFIDREKDRSNRLASSSSDLILMQLPVGERIIQFIHSSFIKVKGILSQLPSRLWITVGIVFFGYTSMYGLAIIGPDLFMLKYGFNEQSASLILSSETLCSCLMSPLFGLVIRKIGKRLHLLAVSIVLLAMGIILLETTDIHPLPWIILSGTGFALMNTTIISSLPLYIPSEVLGTSFGFIGTAYNTGLVIYPPILGALKVSTGTYTASLYLLFGNCIVALMLVALLLWVDLKSPRETRLSQ
ncbi:hypothetical protein PPL_12544 [Heterostelium album PN500]|uniref:Lysosomal dipeptide transporter MFSD1 n=1 Tax=Heterostelium pallidum (strain ATCC 26659 / Pp 5 / PN500) TaxID=670386 RepID=D3BMX1_HETP5|nr:hypothetical protein PPL_12544 [Heterostelium album PN500]EFA77333.1 hypothetical protein PPL_12544 [Heterostelium album PN500]|eukprot:XP_020429462.1 hypothetical protein PPL_12544 [Heterostelium album PN500]